MRSVHSLTPIFQIHSVYFIYFFVICYSASWFSKGITIAILNLNFGFCPPENMLLMSFLRYSLLLPMKLVSQKNPSIVSSSLPQSCLHFFPPKSSSFFFFFTVAQLQIRMLTRLDRGIWHSAKTLTHIKALLIVSETKWCFTSTCLLLTTQYTINMIKSLFISFQIASSTFNEKVTLLNLATSS